jgi:AcrR family transcriptional regulator
VVDVSDAMTAGPTETHRPLRADARRNRERIVQAARELFAECGPDAQMDDLAARAGVGVGTVYRHFPTKEAVMGELLRQKFELFLSLGRQALEREGEPFEVFADMLRHNAEAMAGDVATQRAVAMGGLALSPEAEAARDQLMAVGRELIARAHAAGTLRPDFTIEDVPTIMCGVSATMGDPRFDWRRHLEMLIDGLRARGPVPAG